MRKVYRINLSEKVKTFAWLWPKTATQTMWEVLKHFHFQSIEIENFHRTEKTHPDYSHDCALFQGHQDYKLLISVRNPYTKFFSFHHYMSEKSKNTITLETFENFLDIHLDNLHSQFCTDFSIRKPDYFVRVESMIEDYSKIPFISESELFSSGMLGVICSKRKNETTPPINWREFYNQELADRVYYKHVDYFNLFNYDRDSWKN